LLLKITVVHRSRRDARYPKEYVARSLLFLKITVVHCSRRCSLKKSGRAEDGMVLVIRTEEHQLSNVRLCETLLSKEHLRTHSHAIFARPAKTCNLTWSVSAGLSIFGFFLGPVPPSWKKVNWSLKW
jgi:hypothetical protein